MKKSIVLTIFLFLFQFALYSQNLLFKGIVKDDHSLNPIPEVNIKVYGTNQGTATDNIGKFSIKLEKIPCTIVFSCIGYENEYYKVTETPKEPIEFLLSSKSYMLKEVNISSKNYSFLFKDKDYSVLDYELMDDNVLLLIFRTQIKKSQLILLSRSGDTLAISTLPELPPSKLFKDFLSNIHYFTKSGYAYECYYNKPTNGIDYIYKTTVDSLLRIINPFIFNMDGRLYFQQSIANKFGTAIGYYEKGTGKHYIRKVINMKKIKEYIDDQKFYAKWNRNSGVGNSLDVDDVVSGLAFDFSISQIEGGAYGSNEARAHSFEFFNMTFPIIKTRDNTLAFFNFGEDIIELMNKDGRILNTVPISFHKENISLSDTLSSIRFSDSGWRWGNMILVDEFNRNVYTTFLKFGMIRINRIDLETGKLSKGTVIPLLFPEKIEIYDGEAYFLNLGQNDNWKLAKCKL